jgi:hypothetical protein
LPISSIRLPGCMRCRWPMSPARRIYGWRTQWWLLSAMNIFIIICNRKGFTNKLYMTAVSVYKKKLQQIKSVPVHTLP